MSTTAAADIESPVTKQLITQNILFIKQFFQACPANGRRHPECAKVRKRMLPGEYSKKFSPIWNYHVILSDYDLQKEDIPDLVARHGNLHVEPFAVVVLRQLQTPVPCLQDPVQSRTFTLLSVVPDENRSPA